jgi:Ca-activated chloride channel family protein
MGKVAARRAPQPTEFNTEAYAHNADNVAHNVVDSALSTFSIDVDTASYSNVRRFLRDRQRPPVDAVRIEELINYFRYDYPNANDATPFSVSTEIAAAPWNPRHRLVRIGLRARDIAQAQVPARNLVFLVDVSGSMQSDDKLPLLKHGLSMLVEQLRPQDHIALVAYAGASGLVLPSTSGNQRGRIMQALEALEAGGSTNGADGIELAYRVAQEGFMRGGINRVILATDGDFNVGVTSEGELTRLIEKKREGGVFLTVLGFGTGNLKDATMENLADKGNGHYAYIDSAAEAHKVLVREAGSTLVTVAKDVKLQVEWNPKQVATYRLIGYENRVLADRDFNDDKKDAGDLGAGHTVTALYEVELAARQPMHGPEVDPLRYQADRALTPAADNPELLTVKVRYKRPDANDSALFSEVAVDHGLRIDESSDDFRWSAAVAGFGMLLRGSEARGDATLSAMRSLARTAVGNDPHGDRREFLQLMEQAAQMGIGG